MVHLAELINSYVEVEKASGDVKEVVSPSPRPQITFEAQITLQGNLHFCCWSDHLYRLRASRLC